MLINEYEYQRMFEAESHLWWYKILHEKILKLISLNKNDKNLKILDAGCGTGGLITFLKKNGYLNIKGFDYSDAAVSFCKQRNLAHSSFSTWHHRLLKLSLVSKPAHFIPIKVREEKTPIPTLEETSVLVLMIKKEVALHIPAHVNKSSLKSCLEVLGILPC